MWPDSSRTSPQADEKKYYDVDAAASVEGTGEIEVYLVWDPAWDMEKMSEDAKLALGMY